MKETIREKVRLVENALLKVNKLNLKSLIVRKMMLKMSIHH